jgi:sugar phosphate permease
MSEAGLVPDGMKGKGAAIALLLFLSTLVGYLTRVNISVALPFIGQAYGWDSYQSGLWGGILLGMFLVGYGFSNIFLAPVIDRIGPRRTLISIMIIWSLITFFTGIIGLLLGLFILFRLVLGLSEGPLFPSDSKITREWFDPRTRTKVNSVYFGALYASNLLAAALLVPLILATSWPWAFYSVGIAGLILAVILYFSIKDTPRGNYPRQKVEFRQQMRRSVDSVKRTIKLKGIGILALSDITTNLAWWGLSLWLPTYLIMAKGFTASDLVWAASLPYLGGLLGLLVGSTISARTGRLVEVAVVFGLLCGLFMFFVIPATNFIVIIVLLALVFFFIAIIQPNQFSLLQDICPEELIGGATGFLNGVSVGLGVFGPIVVGLAVALTGAYALGLVLLGIFQLISGITMIFFRKYHTPGTHEHAQIYEGGT